MTVIQQVCSSMLLTKRYVLVVDTLSVVSPEPGQWALHELYFYYELALKM